MKYLKNLSIYIGILFFMGVFTLTSCNNKKSDIDQTAEEIADAFRSEQEELKADLKEIRKKINNQAEELREDLKTANAEAKEEIQKQLDKLENWGQKVDKTLKDMGQSIEVGWDQFKQDAQTILNDIKREFQELG